MLQTRHQRRHAASLIRGHKVMLDSDLAAIYGVATARLNQQVARNRKRFPSDFMFQLSKQEFDGLMLQNATSSSRHGGRRKLPYVFTEHGAIMAASVLNTAVAVHASVQVVRAFVKLREMVSAHKELALKLAQLERKIASHDTDIGTPFDAIQGLTEPPLKPAKQIGFKLRSS